MQYNPAPMSPAARRTWMVVWIALAAVLLLRAAGRDQDKGVLRKHIEFGRRLLHGDNVYADWRADPEAEPQVLHPPYPPSFGLLTAPFALLADSVGLRPARFAWALLQVLCLVAAAWTLRALTRNRAPPEATDYWHWLWLLMFVFGARFLLRDTHGGGGNVINLGLCLLAFADAEHGRPRRSGIWLGLSLATKPTQLWLLPVFMLLGHRRAVGWTLLSGALLVFASLVLLRFDVAPWLRWIEGSWAIGTQPDAFAVPALGFPEFEWMNQSLRMALHRWLGSVPPEFASRVAWGITPGLGLPLAAVAWITRLFSLGLLGLVLLQSWRRRADPSSRLWTFAAALVVSVLLSPLSWKAHHVALLPVLFLLLQQALATKSKGLWALLGLWAICCLPGRDLVGDAADEWMNSIYIVTAWDIVLLVFALRCSGRGGGAR